MLPFSYPKQKIMLMYISRIAILGEPFDLYASIYLEVLFLFIFCVFRYPSH